MLQKNMKLLVFLLAFTVLVSAVNAYTLYTMKSPATAVQQQNTVLPSGVPEVYGVELQISFDDVSPTNQRLADLTIAKLSQFDRTINFEGELLQRYINILYAQEGGISCEYCCGAKSVIFKDGSAACACAHSYAMRGIAKYLLTKHSDMSDTEILTEVAKWKTLFFPSQIQAKATILQQQGVDTSFINLATNKYRGIEKGTTGGMVGGC